jgi:low affinity Fe/Cu permease
MSGNQNADHISLLFENFARTISNASGRPGVFIIALAIIVVWGITGPLFHFSDTWQLVINTGTSVVTFLMVFLIQQSQNRDTRAIQIKLAELVIAAAGAENKIAVAEDLSERELEALHKHYCERANQALEHLETHRQRHRR